MREVTLPSGATLKINAAPFADAKALQQALMREAKGIQMLSIADIVKDGLCSAMSSREVDAALWKCLERCQYCDGRGELKIDKDTFEPESARQDYMKVCVEVAKENVGPFVKSLLSDYETAVGWITAIRK